MTGKIIHHGASIVLDYRRKSIRRALRHLFVECRFIIRVCMVMTYCGGIGFAVGTWVGVFIS